MTTKQTACGELVRFVMEQDDRDGIDRPTDVDYYARGVGWTSYGAAVPSWTPGEQDEVRAWRTDHGIE
jgi:hypothetical protein